MVVPCPFIGQEREFGELLAGSNLPSCPSRAYGAKLGINSRRVDSGTECERRDTGTLGLVPQKKSGSIVDVSGACRLPPGI